MIEPLAWDSRTFGYSVGRMRYSKCPNREESLQLAKEGMVGQYRLVYCVWPGKDGIAADGFAFSFAGTLCDWVADLNQDASVRTRVEGVSQCREMNDHLLHLALESGWRSRFRMDPGFRHGEFETLYRLWLEKALRSTGGGGCFVVGSADTPAGFLTLETSGNSTAWKIGLLAVDENSRRQGVARNLLAFAKAWSWERKCRHLEVRTQWDNLPAMSLYEANGFSLMSTESVAHLWLPSGTDFPA